jgi:hypothetical protein
MAVQLPATQLVEFRKQDEETMRRRVNVCAQRRDFVAERFDDIEVRCFSRRNGHGVSAES